MAVKTVSAEKMIGDLTVKLTSVSKTDAFERLKAALKFIATLPVDPGYGQGGAPGVDNTLPGGGGSGGAKPDNTLPGDRPPHASGQPVPGGKPDNTLPGGGGGSTKPSGEQPSQLPAHPTLGEHADEIAKAILKGTACDPDHAQPKR